MHPLITLIQAKKTEKLHFGIMVSWYHLSRGFDTMIPDTSSATNSIYHLANSIKTQIQA